MKGTDLFTQHILFQSDWQEGNPRQPEHNEQLTAQDFLCSALLLRTEHYLGWPHSLHVLLFVEGLPPPVSLLLMESPQDNVAQRCASEGKARCTFSGLSENEQILRITKQLSLPLAALGAAKTNRNSKPVLYTQARCKYFSRITDSGNYSGERAFLKHKRLVTLHSR